MGTRNTYHRTDEELGKEREPLDYEPPAITSLGSVAELTQGAQASVPDLSLAGSQ